MAMPSADRDIGSHRFVDNQLSPQRRRGKLTRGRRIPNTALAKCLPEMMVRVVPAADSLTLGGAASRR